jgi:6-phosphogluconate dehydrogenase
MGANMVRRLMRHGHACVVHDVDRAAIDALAGEGATPAASLDALAAALEPPRAVWIMVPAAFVDSTVDSLAALLAPGDLIIDGGNSWYHDDLQRARRLSARGIHYVDAGTSGGVWGLDNGYCLMIGGEPAAVRALQPVFDALAPGVDAAPRSVGRARDVAPAERGWLHCGPTGAGHFVKMIHNGIEYGLMAAYAEGFNILAHAGIGLADHARDAETAPLRDPALYAYEFDLAAIAEVWRRGSVIRSWLLDLAAQELVREPSLASFAGRVSDSGEGRWTILAAVETASPSPVLSAALFSRFASRGEDDLANRVLSAMRHAFGGHVEKPAVDDTSAPASDGRAGTQ